MAITYHVVVPFGRSGATEVTRRRSPRRLQSVERHSRCCGHVAPNAPPRPVRGNLARQGQAVPTVGATYHRQEGGRDAHDHGRGVRGQGRGADGGRAAIEGVDQGGAGAGESVVRDDLNIGSRRNRHRHAAMRLRAHALLGPFLPGLRPLAARLSGLLDL